MNNNRLTILGLHVVLTGLVATLGLAALANGVYLPPESHAPIAVVNGLAVIGLIAWARYGLGFPWLSASVIYLMLFWMFHFGMTFTAVFVPELLTTLDYELDLEWMYWPNVRASMILATIGAAAFTFGAGFVGGRGRRERPIDALAEAGEPVLYAVGWVLLVVGATATIFIIGQNAGLDVFSMSYLTFLALVEATWLGTTLGLAHLGCLLAASGAGRRRWMAPVGVWAVCIGLPMLLLGLRSAALIPSVTLAVVLTHRGVRFPRGLLAAAVVAALIVIPAVKAFRLVGFGNRSMVNWTQVTPLETFMELGGSLRATKAHLDWIEQGDPYLLGASYWAPFDRQVFSRIIPGREVVPYEQDERIPLRLMVDREGSVGGSATGEAFYNFGPAGPLLFFGLVGVLFGWLERRSTSPYACAFLGIVMSLLYFNIRGDWLAVPSQLAQGLLLLGCCRLVAHVVLPIRPHTGSADPLPGRSAVSAS